MAGSKWAQVIEKDFKRKLKKFRTSSKVPKDWAKELGLVIREKFSQASIEKEIDKLCREVSP